MSDENLAEFHGAPDGEGAADRQAETLGERTLAEGSAAGAWRPASSSGIPHGGQLDASQLVNLWGKRARRSEAAHYGIAASYLRRNQFLSFTVIALSAITGSGIFATLSTTEPKPTRFAFGVIGILTAVLAGMNRSLRYGERAEENRQAGARWAPVVNSAEKLLTRLAVDPSDEVAKQIDILKGQIDDVSQRSPSIPQAFIKKNGIMDAYLWQPQRTARGFRRRGQRSAAAPRPEQPVPARR